MPAPESMLAQRSIGVMAPALDQPPGYAGVELAEVSLGGEHQLGGLDVGVEAERRQVGGGHGRLEHDGVSGKDCDTMARSGAMSAAVEPTAENRPSSGAGTPEKASHGVLLDSVVSSLRAAEAVIA